MKTCPKCKQNLSIDAFPKSRQKKDGLYPYCKKCCVKRTSAWRKQHGEWEIQNRKERKQRNRLKVWEYLKTHPCMDCNESDIRVLQFDHKRDKIKEVSVLIANAVSIDRIFSEIAKCEVVCANCHIKRTSIQFNWYQ